MQTSTRIFWSSSTAARNKTERCRVLSRTALSNYLALMHKLTDLSPAERKKYKQQVCDTLAFSPASAEEWLKGFFETEGLWNEAKLFFSLLTPAQQEKLVTASASYTFQADQLAPMQYQQYHNAFKSSEFMRAEPDGTYKPVPEPKEFSLVVVQSDLTKFRTGATVYIHYPDGGGETFLGSGYLNGGIQRFLHQAWLLPGDQTNSPLEQRMVPAGTSEQTTTNRTVEPRASDPRPLYPHVMQMTEQTKIPMLAIFSPPSGDISAPADKKVEELLAPLQKVDFEIYKWRNGVLLLNNTAWFEEREPAVPSEWLSLLQEGPQNQMTLAGLVKFNAKLNPAQLHWLGRSRGLGGVEPLHLLLQYANEHPNAMTEAGSVVSVDDVRFFIALGYIWVGTPDTTPARVRLTLIDTDDPETKTPQVRVDIYDAKKQAWKISAIHELARPRAFIPEQAAMYRK